MYSVDPSPPRPALESLGSGEVVCYFFVLLRLVLTAQQSWAPPCQAHSLTHRETGVVGTAVQHTFQPPKNKHGFYSCVQAAALFLTLLFPLFSPWCCVPQRLSMGAEWLFILFVF